MKEANVGTTPLNAVLVQRLKTLGCAELFNEARVSGTASASWTTEFTAKIAALVP